MLLHWARSETRGSQGKKDIVVSFDLDPQWRSGDIKLIDTSIEDDLTRVLYNSEYAIVHDCHDVTNKNVDLIITLV